jgi:hypothetical protein
MMDYNELISSHPDDLVPHADRLRLAVAAYLARFKGLALSLTLGAPGHRLCASVYGESAAPGQQATRRS